MFTNKTRHLVVALALVAVAGITATSAAGFVHNGSEAATATDSSRPMVSGDLGEVVVLAPHDLGEVIVHAPHDLGEVLVNVAREPAPGTYLAQIEVTAPRARGGFAADELNGIVAAVR